MTNKKQIEKLEERLEELHAALTLYPPDHPRYDFYLSQITFIESQLKKLLSE